jgi:hypothetical protein
MIPLGISVTGQIQPVLGHAFAVMQRVQKPIHQLTPAGTNWVVTTMAGLAGSSGTSDGPGSAARFNHPSGVAVDSVETKKPAFSGELDSAADYSFDFESATYGMPLRACFRE